MANQRADGECRNKLTPELAIQDLKKWTYNQGFLIDKEATSLCLHAEGLGHKYNIDIYDFVFLTALIERIEPLKFLMARNGLDVSKAIQACHEHIANRHESADKYDDNLPPYSDTTFRGGCRDIWIDYAILAAERHKRKKITSLDFLEGILESHDHHFPATENAQWADLDLNVPFNTLSHIIGTAKNNLWIKFDNIRHELGLLTNESLNRIPYESAPVHLKLPLLSFFEDHPNYRKNCFLVMPFASTSPYPEIHNTIKTILGTFGFNLLRADDKSYAEDVLANIETYMYGCSFGIAVHDHLLSQEPNANVALEVGYLFGQKKHVCLLKQNSLKALPSDLQGRLYVEFDPSNLVESVKDAISKWLKDKRLINDKMPHKYRKKTRKIFTTSLG